MSLKLHNGTVLNNGVTLTIGLLWQKFVFHLVPYAFAFCKDDLINALCHQEQNIPYHHKGKTVSWVLSFLWHIGKVTYWIFHGGLYLPSFTFLLFIFCLTHRTRWLIELLYQRVFLWNTMSITLNYNIMSLSLKILEEEIWINHGQELSFTMAD